MKSIKYELKYCEGCGTLRLRPIFSANNYCVLCERLLSRFRFPQRAERKMRAGILLPAGEPTWAGRTQ